MCCTIDHTPYKTKVMNLFDFLIKKNEEKGVEEGQMIMALLKNIDPESRSGYRYLMKHIKSSASLTREIVYKRLAQSNRGCTA